jgi:hypothetical protein
LRIVALSLALAALAASAAGQPEPAPILTIAEHMRHVTNPAAEAFWASSGVVEDAAGAVDRTPGAEDAARWKAAADAASVVQESANLLLTPGRGPDDAPWRDYAAALARAGEAGRKAALARDGEALFTVGGEMYEACRGCHLRYAPRRG